MGAGPPRPAGVVEDAVEGTPGAGRSLERGAYVRLLGDVRAHEAGAVAVSRVTRQLDRLGPGLRVQIRHHDAARAFGEKTQHRRASDPVSPAGDYGHLAFESS